jgi:alginate O-acetyltransferase complex protein AlgJ
MQMGVMRERAPRRALLAAPMLLAPVVGAPGAAMAQGAASTVVIGRNGWLFPLWDRLDRLDAAGLRVVVQMLGEATGILKQARIDLVFLLLPSKGRVYRRFLPEGARISPEVDRRYASVAADLRRAGAVVPDLDTVFREAAAREPHWPLYFKSDTHWTPVGAELAAVTTANDMRAQLRLPPSQRPGTALGEFRMMRLALGDLVQYVPPAQRSGFGPEESPIRDVATAGGAAGLLDEDVNDVQVVGTSNVQPRFGFQPVLSNQIMRPVGLSWRPNNIGPYAALLEYVRSNDFRRQRPRAIVWNHLEADMSSLPNNQNWQRAAMTSQAFLTELRRAVS